MSSFQQAVLNAIKEKVNPRVDSATNKLLVEIRNDTDQYVPYRSGMLSKEVEITSNSLSYTAPHANHVYEREDANFNKDVHSLARAYWLDSSIAINKDRWIRNFKKNL